MARTWASSCPGDVGGFATWVTVGGSGSQEPQEEPWNPGNEQDCFRGLISLDEGHICGSRMDQIKVTGLFSGWTELDQQAFT